MSFADGLAWVFIIVSLILALCALVALIPIGAERMRRGAEEATRRQIVNDHRTPNRSE